MYERTRKALSYCYSTFQYFLRVRKIEVFSNNSKILPIENAEKIFKIFFPFECVYETVLLKTSKSKRKPLD